MTYLWLKALHVAAVIGFVGGVLATSIVLASLRPAGPLSRQQRALVEVVRRWDRAVTTPAMLLVWALGLVLALQGGWFASGWLPVKLAFVVALSGLHGVLSGCLRRAAAGDGLLPAGRLHLAAPVVLAMAAVIAVLVVVKPF